MSGRIFLTTDAVGGVWRYSAQLAAHLADDGYAVKLGVIGPAPTPSQRNELAAFETVEIAPVDAPLDWLAGSGQAIAAGGEAIAEAARDWKADIIQLNQPAFADADYSAPTIVKAHSCVTTWWRATKGEAPPAEWDWHAGAVREGFRRASLCCAPSAAFAAALQEAYALNRRPVVVRNGVRDRSYFGAKDQFVFAAGRVWDESKNFAVLDAAAQALDWPVRLAGSTQAPDGQPRAALRNVCCLGTLDAQTMAVELGATPIFVSPSLYEPFGLAVLEAAQAGAALVLAEIPTFRELWNDAALFFDPRDPAALADAVNSLIRDPQLRRRNAAAAEARAGDYTSERSANGMASLYRAMGVEDSRRAEARVS